ncbi:hypothetical protein ACHAPF_005553 [Botrytis cinerea]
MAYHTSQGNGLDQSTSWSGWIWVPEQSYWYSYRVNAEGKEEYDYRYPEGTENRAATPRTSDLTDVYPSSQTGDSNSFDNNATPRPSHVTSTSNHNFYDSSDSTAQNYAINNSNVAWQPENPSSSNAAYQSNTDATSSSIEATARAFETMLLETPRSVPTETTEAFDPEVNQVIINAKHISKAPNTGNAETLDSRYTVYGGLHRQDDFWKVGRVFMMLWTEPAQPKVPAAGGTRNGSHFSTTFLGEQAYSEIRSPIQTYSGQATLKPNLPAPGRHTIIHTTPRAPEEHSYVASNGQSVYEHLVLDPIQVDSERSHEPEGLLHPLSRLNYSKVYTVEHYVRVLNIGMVAITSIGTFLSQSGWPQNVQPVGSQRPHSNRPSRRISGQSSNNRRNRREHK